jgi:GxxExxY protein
METEFLYKEECGKIIKACYEVHNILGRGFLENVYQETLSMEFQIAGVPFEMEKKLELFYKGVKLKKFYEADFICYNKIIVELKSCESINEICPGS